MTLTYRGITGFFVFFLSLPVLANASIHFTDTWARATFPMAETGAVYTTLMNHSQQPLTLVSVSVPEAVADSAEIHSTTMSEGMMKMRELEGGIELKPHGHAMLQPGGQHIMLVGLKEGLEPGTSFTLTLHFSDGSHQSLEVPVQDDSGDDDVMGKHHH